MKRALFIFRRDLRLQDNTALIAAMKAAEEVIAAFVFTPDQIQTNAYKSDSCLQFMIESLEDLDNEITKHKGKLYLFYGEPEKLVSECIEKLAVDGVFVNRDYTPYSLERDKKIETACRKLSVPFRSYDDLLLQPPENTLKSDGTPYTIFTPFFRNALKLPIPQPKSEPEWRFYAKPIDFSQGPSLFDKVLPKRKEQLAGGRTACLHILRHLTPFSKYHQERDFPALDKTTHLSPHLKFTTCSIREIYHAIAHQLGAQSELIRALYWRDFFSSIAFYFPHVFKGSFKPKYDSLEWNYEEEFFKRWCEGTTGFPIVDAGMRELNATGFMHNRVRMITASFLIKDLHVDWRLGEKYFARHLIDYDPAVNNGNWQWCASTGCDAQPYFRIFNPWSQGIKFDPDCLYIKQWVPELSQLPPSMIHGWLLPKNRLASTKYPSPIIDHSEESAIALNTYKKVHP